MKILLVSSFLPYPLLSGGNVRLFNLLKYLQKKHQVTLVCEIRSNQTEKDRLAVEKICQKVITIPRKKQWSPENISKTGFSLEPFLLVGHKLSVMKNVIAQELAKETYDLIHVETFYVYQNLPETSLPIVLVEHNIEYLIYQRFAQKMPLPIRFLLNIDIKKLIKKEEENWREANVVVAVSADEERVIKKMTPKTAVVANGVDLEKFTVKSEKLKISEEKKILFIGDFKYIQNQDAAFWIIDEVFPQLQQSLGEMIKLWLVGRNMPDGLKRKASKYIIMDDDSQLPTEEIFHQADMLLAPIRVGGGTSYKILEAMACGTPVITTTLGNEGINAIERKDILIADTPEEMVNAVTEVLSHRKLYETIAENGRKVVEERFSWEKIGKDLEEVYERVVGK